METSLEAYDRLSAECRETFRRKNADYGDSFREDGTLGVLIRMKDKISRAITLIRNEGEGALVKDEALRDTLLDHSNYSKMAVICMDAECQK